MKKLLLFCSLSSLATLNAAVDANVWKGAPDALRKAAHNKEVRTALEVLGSDFANLMRVYTEQLKPRLTPAQKKELSFLLQRARLIIKKTRELAQKGGDDQRLQEEIQAVGQELVMAYFPLLLTIQQEVTDEEAAEIENELRMFTAKGYDMLDNAVNAMLKVLK